MTAESRSMPAQPAESVSRRGSVVVVVCRPDPWMTALRRALVATFPASAADAGWASLTIDADAPDPAWRALAAALPGMTAPNLLLAVEIPVGTGEASLRALHALLASSYQDVRAAAWVRSPREAMEAALQEILVAEHGLPPREADELYPRYRELFATLDEVFGRGQVVLAKLETHALPFGDILQGLALWLGLDVPADARARPAPAWLSPAPLSLLYAYRGAHPGVAAQPATNRRLARVLARLRGRRLRLSPDALRPLFVRQREDITWMELRLGIPLSEDMSAAPADVTALPALADISAETREQLQRLMNMQPVAHTPAASPDAAALVEYLRRQVESWPDDAGEQDAALGRLFNRAVSRDAEALEGLPPAQAVEFLRIAFTALRAEVRAMTDAPVGLSSFGQFRRPSSGTDADGSRPVQFFPLTVREP